MVLRQVRKSAKELIDGTIDPARDLGGGWAKLLKRGAESYCDLYSKAPQFLFETPGTGFAQGALNEICGNRDGFEPPSATYDDSGDKQIQFEGGQCPKKYEVTATATTDKCDDGDVESTSTTGGFTREIYGPITSIQKVVVPEGQGEANPDEYLAVRFFGQDDQGNSDFVDILVASDPVSGRVAWDVTCGSNPDLDFVARNPEIGITPIDGNDDCGDPEIPDQPDQWDDPENDPPELDVDIDIDPPDGYTNFPTQRTNIIYNPDNRQYEGDKFTIKLEPPDLIIEYDDEDPPDFLEGGLPQGLPKLPPASDFIPEGLRDKFPTIPKFLRESFDKIDDFIPTPLPGVSVGDLLDLLGDGEDSEPIDQVAIPYYDCDAEEFASITWEVVRSSWSDSDIETLTTNADNAKLWCDEPNLIIGYPDWWAIRAGANRPQIVQIFRRDGSRTYHSLVIPHYNREPEPETAAIGEYQSGNLMCREILTDNSALLVYAVDEDEGERVLDEMASWVKSEMRTEPPERTFQRRQGRPVAESRRIPRVVEIWQQGRKSGGAPDKQWKCPPFNEPIP